MAENRSDVVDFMMPFIEDHLRIAVKFPEENENMFFNIFDVCVNTYLVTNISLNVILLYRKYLQIIFCIINVNIVE